MKRTDRCPVSNSPSVEKGRTPWRRQRQTTALDLAARLVVTSPKIVSHGERMDRPGDVERRAARHAPEGAGHGGQRMAEDLEAKVVDASHGTDHGEK